MICLTHNASLHNLMYMLVIFRYLSIIFESKEYNFFILDNLIMSADVCGLLGTLLPFPKLSQRVASQPFL